MQENIKEFLEKFQKVKSKGFILTHRRGNTGIGKTFEDVCGIIENNHDLPDFKGIEIKSRRDFSSSFITLFTKAPTFPKGINSILRVNYGSSDSKYPDMKVLHTSCFCMQFNTHKSGFGFKLEPVDSEEKIYLKIKNITTGQLEDCEVYWDYSSIKDIIEKKLSYIAIVDADTQKTNEGELFYFKSCTILNGLTLSKFIDLINNNMIMFDIRIGVYKTGANSGKTHDHGSGFRIHKKNLDKAFNILQVIEE